MSEVISNKSMSKVLSRAIQTDLFDENDNSVIFYDLTFLEKRIAKLKEFFPANTLHALAIKANPLPGILKRIKKLEIGLEAASIGEVYIALKCGYEPQRIVFDSPAKTVFDLKFALKKNILINANSFFELERIAHIKKKIDSKSKIGLRINPQIGEGTIKITSVAGRVSKFGIPLKEAEKEIINAFRKYTWLSGLHIHIGSQGFSIEQHVKSCKVILNLARTIGKQIKWIDIGGGISANYSGKTKPSHLKIYTQKLNQECPQIFNNSYDIITEFGRSIFANSGWTATRVEYVMSYSKKIAVINVGADLFLRESFQPDTWKHQYSITDKRGNLKTTDQEDITIAGPLCYNGDIMASEIKLPHVKQGDFFLIHDSGAYNLSMWSRYNSRMLPKVIGYQNEGEHFVVLKNKETLEEIYQFWI